jgi:hypothetical protein
VIAHPNYSRQADSKEETWDEPRYQVEKQFRYHSRLDHRETSSTTTVIHYEFTE